MPPRSSLRLHCQSSCWFLRITLISPVNSSAMAYGHTMCHVSLQPFDPLLRFLDSVLRFVDFALPLSLPGSDRVPAGGAAKRAAYSALA